MKKNIFWMLAAGVFALTSCSDDDENNNNQNDDQAVGTYRLAAYTAPAALDLDNDGDSSSDLSTEYNCYADWEIVLNSDQTFTRTHNITGVTDGDLTCQIGQTATGTWSRNGQTLTLINANNGDELTEEYTFSSNNEILTKTGPGQYPIIFENIFIMEGGTITVVYSKVDDGVN